MNLEGGIDLSAILRAGVYALCWRGSVVYVGQSKAFLSRIATHKQQRGRSTPSWVPVKGITFDEVHVWPEPEPDRRSALERELIDRYKPRHNTQHYPTGPSRAPVSLSIAGIELRLNPRPQFERRAF